MKKNQGNDEFIFRFPFGGERESPAYQNKLAEMVRRQLLALLDVIVLTQGSQIVKIDGFKFISEIESDNIYPLWQGSISITAIDSSSPESG